MPYEIRKSNNRYCVYKVGDSEALQCYNLRQDAIDYLAALESNVEDAKMKTAQRRLGAPIKALDDNGLRIGGYLVRFTSADDTDLYGEFFDKDTDFWIAKGYPVKGERALLEHGLEDFAKVMPIGLIDMVKEDEFGIYVEAKLNDRAEYERMLRDMRNRRSINLSDSEIVQKAELAERAIRAIVETGKVQWSSGALPQGVVVDEETKHIKSWPIIEGSLTFTPAENEGTEIAPIKSALMQLEEFLKSFPAQTPKDAQHIEAKADESYTVGTDMATGNSLTVVTFIEASPTKTLKQGKNTMEILQKIAAMIQEYLAAMAGEEGALESEAMASAVVDELKAEVPEEEMKAAAEDEEMAKAIAEKALAIADARLAKRQKSASAMNGVLDARLKKMERQEEPRDPFGAGGMRNSFTGRASVGEERKYAHLSASDMALGIIMKLAPAKSQGIHTNMRDAFSETYLRTFAAKAMKFADSDPYTKGKLAGKSFGHWQQAQSADSSLKSLIPFRANELNASDISGQGSDWVSEWWSTDLWERERFERHYDALVQRGMMVQTIPQGADTAHFPTEGSDPVAYVAPQANSVDSTGRPETTANFSPYGTGVVDCTPLEIKIATSQTVILEEDSIINVVQNVNRQLNEAALETRDKLLVNGDDSLGTTNINYDGTQVPLGLQRPYYTASDGFRLHGLTNNAVDASNTLALETYRLTLAELDPELRQYYERMVFFIDPTTEMASLAIPDIATDDVRRSFATVTSGRILNVYGVDVRVNGFIPQTDSDGKVTASGNVVNRGSILLVYAPYWGFAYKRNITLETARNIWSGTNDYVMSMRIGMVARGTNATALTYNVATAVT